MADKTLPVHPPLHPPEHPRLGPTHESDPPTPIKIQEDRVLRERIAREQPSSNPVAGHGDPEREHDHGGTQKRRRRR